MFVTVYFIGLIGIVIGNAYILIRIVKYIEERDQELENRINNLEKKLADKKEVEK